MTEASASAASYLQPVQRVDLLVQTWGSEELLQVHRFGVQTPPAVVSLHRSKAGVEPEGRQVRLQIHVHSESTEAQQDRHLDQALREELLQVQHLLQELRGAAVSADEEEMLPNTKPEQRERSCCFGAPLLLRSRAAASEQSCCFREREWRYKKTNESGFYKLILLKMSSKLVNRRKTTVSASLCENSL